jgi:Sulfotransferase domain
MVKQRSAMRANKIGAELERIAFLGRKSARQRIAGLLSASHEKRATLVCGVQRSGTDMLMNILEKSLETDVYHEHDRRAFSDYQLLAPPVIRNLIQRSPARRVVMKALCDADRISELLRSFAPANAIWMVRRYDDTINSNMSRWPGGRNQLDKIVLDRSAGGWRGRGMTDETHALIRRHYHRGMNDASALALFWYYRNQLLFDQKLEEDPRLLILRYESLVEDPASYGAVIAQFVDIEFAQGMVDFVFQGSIGKRPRPEIEPPIRDLCDGMLDRLTRLSQRVMLHPNQRREPALVSHGN